MSSESYLRIPKYRKDIDGLRAVAVLSVVIYHAFPEILRGGFVGVDIFFVISGFLISTIIFENLDNNSFGILEFYAGRIRRIFPALILVLASCFSFGWSNLLADEYRLLGKHIAASMGFIQNFILWNEAGYFDFSAETKPLLHLWSLGVEEQFYIVFPFLLWAAWKKKFNLLIPILIVGAISFYLNLAGVHRDEVATFFSPQTRLWELLSGSILSFLLLYKHDRFEPILFKINDRLNLHYCKLGNINPYNFANCSSVIGLVLITWSVTKIEETWAFPGGWAIIPVLGSVLIIAAGQKAWVNRFFLSNRIAVWFGLISYPLYLWHWPLLSLARILTGKILHRDVRLTLVGASIVLATLTYVLIERPIRFGKYKTVKAYVLIFLALAVGYAGFYTYQQNGLSFRSVVNVGLSWLEQNNRSQDCLVKVDPYKFSYCVISKDFPVKIALIGDSHANAMFPFVRDYFGNKALGVIQIGRGGCPPFLYIKNDDIECTKEMNDIVSFVTSHKEIEKVYLTGRYALYLSGLKFGVEIEHDNMLNFAAPRHPDRPATFEIGLSKIIEQLQSADKEISIILDVPELNFDPRICLGEKNAFRCSIEKNVVLDRQSEYRKIVNDLSKKYNFKIIDLINTFCPDQFCFAKSGEDILYRDSHHLGILGSKFLLSKNIQLD